MSASFQALIPARYPAERLPGKLLLDLEGKTVLRGAWERACRSAALPERFWALRVEAELEEDFVRRFLRCLRECDPLQQAGTPA